MWNACLLAGGAGISLDEILGMVQDNRPANDFDPDMEPMSSGQVGTVRL